MMPATLRALRAEFGLSFDWIADHAGVDGAQLAAWEAGQAPVPDAVARLMAELDRRAEQLVRHAVETVEAIMVEQGAPPEAVELHRYATDTPLWDRHPDFRPLPASWHRAALARLEKALARRGIRARYSDQSPRVH